MSILELNQLYGPPLNSGMRPQSLSTRNENEEQWSYIYFGDIKKKSLLLQFNLNCLKYFILYFKLTLCRPEVDQGLAVGEGLDSAEAIQSFAATLVPLLLEVWVEASASDSSWSSNDGSHLLTPDSMSVMFQVLSILQLLRKLAPQKDHRDALVRL